MSFASGSRHSVAYEEELAFGVLNVTPDMKALSITGSNLGLSRDPIVSNTLRSDRQIQSVRSGNQSVAGDLPFEFAYEVFDDFLEAAFFSAYTGEASPWTLLAGTAAKSFTIERGFADIAQYLVYRGCMVDKFKLSVKPNAMITGSFGLVGAGMAVPSGSARDATVTAAANNEPFDSFTGTISEGGGTIAIVTGLDIELNNGLAAKFAIGDASAKEIGSGKSNLTGTLTAFFENGTLLTKFVSETSSALIFTLVDLDDNEYEFTIPSIKYTGGDVPVDGEGSITLTMPFQATYDSAEASNIKIVKTDG